MLDKHHDYIVQRLTVDGISKHSLARELGVIETTLVSYTWRHRIAMREPVPVTDYDWMVKHYGDITIRDMAYRARVSESTMRNRLIDAGIHKPVTYRTSETSSTRRKVLSARWS